MKHLYLIQEERGVAPPPQIKPLEKIQTTWKISHETQRKQKPIFILARDGPIRDVFIIHQSRLGIF